jgi:hypothetical protein
MQIGHIWQFMPICLDPDPQNFSGRTIPFLQIVKFFEDFLQMKNLFDKNCYLPMSMLQKKTSALKREHPALQKNEMY